jgi:hypothetical protein
VTGPLRDANDGAPVPMSVVDPAHEIHPAILGARWAAREVLEFDASPREATREVIDLCIDASGLSPASEPPTPACLTRPVHAWAR